VVQKIVVFGVGEIAEVAHIYLDYDSPYEVVAFTVDKVYRNVDVFRGKPVVDFEAILTHYPPSEFKLFIPISFRDLNSKRAKKYFQAKDKGYQMISYISSKALIMPETELGENCFIFENNVIQPKVKIGNNCIIWSGNHIGHHTTIGEHCFVASHAVISGHVSIGDFSFIGVNATIRDNITIAEKNVIGAGALIVKDTSRNQVFKGQASKPASISSNEITW
jgi:sugar O-acyltransferase (sialic acid O-acetyltransferase NeuD family)